MAINAQKFLPPSRTFAALKPSSVGTGGGTLVRIEKKVITLDKLVKNNLFLQKKGGALALREKNALALQEKEKELEKEKPKKVKGLSIPKLPGFGFLGWVKNWIFNTILGFFVVRMIDHLPKMIKMASFVGPAAEGILNLSGGILNGIISFVDAGYKAVEATRGLVGKTFGNDALKQFDTLANNFENFMNLAIIAAMASSDAIMGSFGKKAAEKGAGTIARRGAGRMATRAGAKVAGKAGAKFGAKIGSKLLKGIPFVGAALAIAEGVMRIREGDVAGGLLSFGSAIPVAGWGFLAVDMLREFGVLKFAGGGYVRRPRKYAGGGSTSPRTLSKKPAKRRVSVAPQKVKPGSDVGGQKKVEKIFPKAPQDKKTKTTDPLGYLETASNTLGKADVFGPLFTIAIKTVLGNKPSSLDYKNAGVALNGWVSNNFASVGKFARGGEVDGRMLFTGEDMSDAIAKAVQTSVSSEVDKTINDLMKQLMLQPEAYQEKKDQQAPTTTPGQMTPGSVPGGQLTMEQLVGLAKGAGFSDREAVIMAAIAMAESGGNSNARNFKPPDKSYGLWQINMFGSLGPARMKEYGLSSESQLLDPVTNAKAAYAIRKSQGLGAWTVYKTGKYKNHLQAAEAARNAPSLAVSPKMGGAINAKGIVEYITGDPNTPVGRFDLSGHGTTGNYHDHIAFATLQDKENAKAALRAAGIQIGSEYRPGDPGYHGKNLAIDVPGHQWGGRGAIGETEYRGSRKVRQILGLTSGKFAVGGRIPRPTVALMGEKGQEFVFDADTTRGLDSMAPGFLDYLNKAKTKPELANILRTYGDEPEVIFVPIPMPSQSQPPMSIGGKSSSGGVVNSQDNSWMFDRLATGTG